jgi:site-specific recombinase XerD
LQAVADFARHFGRSPDKLGPNELRTYQAYLLRDRKLAVGSVVGLVAALRFFFNKTLKRRFPPNDIPYPKHPRRLPAILTVEEVARLIDPACNLFDRTLLTVLYSTGMRNFELRTCKLRISIASPCSSTFSVAKAGVTAISLSAPTCWRPCGSTGGG